MPVLQNRRTIATFVTAAAIRLSRSPREKKSTSCWWDLLHPALFHFLPGKYWFCSQISSTVTENESRFKYKCAGKWWTHSSCWLTCALTTDGLYPLLSSFFSLPLSNILYLLDIPLWLTKITESTMAKTMVEEIKAVFNGCNCYTLAWAIDYSGKYELVDWIRLYEDGIKTCQAKTLLW